MLRIGDVAQVSVNCGIAGSQFQGNGEVLFGFHDFVLREFLDGKVLQSGNEVRVKPQSLLKLPSGPGDLALPVERDAHQVVGLHVFRLRLEDPAKDRNALVPSLLTNQTLSLRVEFGDLGSVRSQRGQ